MSKTIKAETTDNNASGKVNEFTIPGNVLRVVIQVKDTHDNQKAMKLVFDAIKNIPIPDEEHAIIKAEQISIVSAVMAKPKSL